MQEEELSREQLMQEIERLRLEVENLYKEKADLEIMLETTTAHADIVDAQLYELNKQLQAEVVERQRIEAELQTFLSIITKDKADLEILLETTTEHGDIIEDLLHDQAREAIQASDKRLAQFLEAVPVGVAVLDAAGKPYYANYAAQKLLGKGVMPLATSGQVPEVYQLYLAGTSQLYPKEKMTLMRALKGEVSTTSDMEIYHPDKTIPIESWGTPIFDDQGNIAYAIAAFQDITDRQRAEAERIDFTNQLFQLNQAYERFVPREFIQLLAKGSILDIQLGDQVQKEMSVLFADIRNFTGMSEKMTPEETFKFINDYLSHMESAITENHGFIDKYIGDEIMALFSGGADDAVKAAIAMLHQLAEYNAIRQEAGHLPIKIGIGINTGCLMLGTVGGKNRMEGTVISDTVNVASHIESLTKSYGVSLLISQQTLSCLENYADYNFRLIDQVKVKGKSETVTVYEIFDGDLSEVRSGKLATKRVFEEALLLYYLDQFDEAAQLFQDCLRQTPLDKAAQIYLERCESKTAYL